VNVGENAGSLVIGADANRLRIENDLWKGPHPAKVDAAFFIKALYIYIKKEIYILLLAKACFVLV
jgi:hypothetical protein